MRIIWIFILAIGLFGCTDRSKSPTVPAALTIGTNHTVFAATSRQPTRDGQFGFERATELGLLELTVSIPPSHNLGGLEFGYSNPDPETQFVMAARHVFASPAAFKSRLRNALGKLPPAEQEVIIFIHGYNSTQAETAFRAAQLTTDSKASGITMIYSWPSQGKALGYVYDNDSMLFARDGLEQLLHDVVSTRPKRIFLVAHSLGSALLMETLRQIELQKPGWSARELSGVVLISPDLDVQVFRSQISRFAKIPSPFIIFVSKKDAALNLSSKLRGRGRVRLGNINSIDAIADLPIDVLDTTDFSRDALSSHFIPATSPALLTLFANPELLNNTFASERRLLANYLNGTAIKSRGATRTVLLQDDLRD